MADKPFVLSSDEAILALSVILSLKFRVRSPRKNHADTEVSSIGIAGSVMKRRSVKFYGCAFRKAEKLQFRRIISVLGT